VKIGSKDQNSQYEEIFHASVRKTLEHLPVDICKIFGFYAIKGEKHKRDAYLFIMGYGISNFCC
jgi:hypothetical protein